MGLSNTRARLAQLYGLRHTLDVRGEMDGGVEIRITLPLRAITGDSRAADPWRRDVDLAGAGIEAPLSVAEDAR